MDDHDKTGRNLPPADAKTARQASKRGHMGPGYPGGGYRGQRSDWSGGWGLGDEGRGRPHMSGRHGDTAFGRIGPSSGQVPRDPSQRVVEGGVDGGTNLDATGGARPRAASQNAQIAGGSPDTPVARGSENERTAPGISTDKRSDDTRD